MYDCVLLAWSGSTSILKFKCFVCSRILRHRRVVCVFCDISRSLDLNDFAVRTHAVLGLITNQCSCLCVSRRSSVKTVGRSELRLEANSTYCTRKFVSENKCTFVSNWSRTILPRHIDHRLVTVRFLSVYVHCQFFCCSFSGCHFFCSLNYRCRSFRKITLCCPFFLGPYPLIFRCRILPLPNYPVAQSPVAVFSVALFSVAFFTVAVFAVNRRIVSHLTELCER